MNCENITAVKSASKAALCQKAEELLELALLLVAVRLENVVRAGHDFVEPLFFDVQSLPADPVPPFSDFNQLKIRNYLTFHALS